MTTMQQDGSFKAIVNRLNVTPVDDLPRVAAFLATSLATLPLEIYFADTKANPSSVTTHKLKTRITSLLQDRSPAGRLSAVILVKAIIENGGPDLLAASEPWARGLVVCLNKTEPPEIKKLYLFAITRIFVLTQHRPALVREITTPLLPSFMTACLNLIKPITVRFGGRTTSVSSPLLDTVLQCWLCLLPQHASTFRPFLNRIRPMCLSLIGSSGSPRPTSDLSIQLLCALVACAPKNTAPQEWAQMSSSLIEVSHHTANKIFRAVVEEHESNNPSFVPNLGQHKFSEDPEYAGQDQLGLPAWKGISDGGHRLVTLVRWVEGLLSSATSHSISLSLGAILDLVTRITAVTVPKSQTQAGSALRFHIEASKEEKEEVLLNLPSLHLGCLQLLRTMGAHYGQNLHPVHHIICDRTLGSFESMSWHQGIRALSYDIFTHLLKNANLTELDLSQPALSSLFMRCCNDLKPSSAASDTNSINETGRGAGLAAKTVGKPGANATDNMQRDSDVFRSAWRLITEALGYRAAPLISRGLRVEMDRLAILLEHREAMLASTLNPVLSTGGQMAAASILPFLARSASNSTTIESLLRPRFPITQVDTKPVAPVDVAEDTEEEIKGNSERGDILSQLENSLHEMDNGYNKGDHNGNSLGQDLDATMEPVQSPRKRAFDDLDTSRTTITNLTESWSRTSKRQRPEDIAEAVSSVTTEQVSHDIDQAVTLQVEKELAFSAAREDISRMPERDASLVSQPNIIQKENTADSDESDFEIPKIDTGFDTDDDDEGGEEDGE